MARRVKLPDSIPDAQGVPDWHFFNLFDPLCKCTVFNPRKLSSRVEWEDAQHTTADWEVRANGCRYYLRPGRGCKYGDDCEYCHVHPIDPKMPDWSQVIRDPNTGQPRKMRKSERMEQRENRTEAVVAGQEAYRRQLKAIDQDAAFFVNFGAPVHGCHIVFWTIHRLLELAKESAQDAAGKLAADGVTVENVGIWLGVDKLCHGFLHYPLGDAHGVHTLMKGWATRLPQLVQRSDAVDFLLCEADARFVANLGGRLPHLLGLLRENGQPFCLVGFFTDAKRNHEGKWRWTYKTEEQAAAAGGNWNAGQYTNWPFKFRGLCEGNVIPKDGCQAMYIRRDFVKTFCERLLEYETPYGLDMALFDPRLLSDREFAFTSASLAGQKPGQSDSWNSVNMKAGEMTEPDMAKLHIRRFADSENLMQKRRDKWQYVQKSSARFAKSKKLNESMSYKNWKFPFYPADDDVPPRVIAASIMPDVAGPAGSAPRAPSKDVRFPWNLVDWGSPPARSRSPPPRNERGTSSKYPPPTPKMPPDFVE